MLLSFRAAHRNILRALEEITPECEDVAAFSERLARVQGAVDAYIDKLGAKNPCKPDQRLQRLWTDAPAPKTALLAISRRASAPLLHRLAEASWPSGTPPTGDTDMPEVSDRERAYLRALGGAALDATADLSRDGLVTLMPDAPPHIRVVMQAILHRCMTREFTRGTDLLQAHRVTCAAEATRWSRDLLRQGIIPTPDGGEGWRDWQPDVPWVAQLEAWCAQAPSHAAPRTLLRFEGPARQPRTKCARDAFCNTLANRTSTAVIIEEMGLRFAVAADSTLQASVAQSWRQLQALVQASRGCPGALGMIDALCAARPLTDAAIQSLQALTNLDNAGHACVEAFLRLPEDALEPVLRAGTQVLQLAVSQPRADARQALVAMLHATVEPALDRVCHARAQTYPPSRLAGSARAACENWLAQLPTSPQDSQSRMFIESLQKTLARLRQGPGFTAVFAYVLGHPPGYPGTEAQRLWKQRDTYHEHGQALRRACKNADDAALEPFFQAAHHACHLLPDDIKIAQDTQNFAARDAIIAYAASPKCHHPPAKIAAFEFCMSSQHEGAIAQAHSIFARGHTDAFPMAAQAWSGVGPLSTYLENTAKQRFAGNVAELQTCIGSLPLGTTRKQDLWAALVEVALHPPGAASRPLLQPFKCAVCMEEKSADACASLRDCTCAHTICAECCLSAVRLTDNLTDRCPGGCGAPLRREDLERLGLDAPAVGRAMQRMVRATMAAQPDWVCCVTPDCPGGTFVPDKKVESIKCGMCHAVASLNASDCVIIDKLLECLSGSSAKHGGGMTRECYHCGAPTEKGDWCAHMTCGSCGGHWHFVTGPWNWNGLREAYAFGPGEGTGPQQYRPLRNGILGRIGFYQQTPCGTLSAVEQDQIKTRAAQWRDTKPWTRLNV